MRDNYILFTVASTIYGVASQDVAHVELVETVTRVPNTPPYVDGVVFSRGAVVPAVSLRARFGFEQAKEAYAHAWGPDSFAKTVIEL